MEWFAMQGFTVLAPDLAGTGETGPGVFRGDSYIDSVSYNIWFASILIGRSITGIQAGDVVRLARLLLAGKGVESVYGLAERQMAPVLLQAAAFERSIAAVALIEPFSSYRALLTERYYDPDFIHSAVAGSAGLYDLPDLAAGLAPRKLVIAGLRDAGGGAASGELPVTDMEIIRSAYRNLDARGQFQVMPGSSGKELLNVYKKWIGGN